MDIKTKFAPNDNAYHVNGVLVKKVEIKSLEIKSVEIKSETRIDINYISKDNQEYNESDLLSKRELVAMVNEDRF